MIVDNPLLGAVDVRPVRLVEKHASRSDHDQNPEFKIIQVEVVEHGPDAMLTPHTLREGD